MSEPEQSSPEQCCENCKFWQTNWEPGVQNDSERLEEIADESGENPEDLKQSLDLIDKSTGSTGDCRRFPPVYVPHTEDGMGRHPQTYAEDWCGEWRANTPEP